MTVTGVSCSSVSTKTTITTIPLTPQGCQLATAKVVSAAGQVVSVASHHVVIIVVIMANVIMTMIMLPHCLLLPVLPR